MLLLLAPLAWLAVTALVVTACRAAASADRQPQPTTPCSTPRRARPAPTRAVSHS